MSSNTSASASPAAAPVVAPVSKTANKPAATKKVAKALPRRRSSCSQATPTHPSWRDIIKECVAASDAPTRQGVSRNAIKKFAEEQYKLSTPSHVSQLNRAIIAGVDGGVFVQPKGPSGCVKLAPKVRSERRRTRGCFQLCLQARFQGKSSATKPAAKTAAKTAAPVKTKAAPGKKQLAGKPNVVGKKSSSAPAKAKTAVSKKATPAAKAKIAAASKKAAPRAAPKPRSTAKVPSFTPTVSLLTDLPQFQVQSLGKMTVHSVLKTINDKKLKRDTFYFGSTLADLSLNTQNAQWTSDRFEDTWNLAVAENDCKWFSNEPAEGVFNLTACESLRNFAFQRGIAFRGHNTLWHNQRPDWLVNDPLNIAVAQLNKTTIPAAVRNVIEGLGKNLISWDVVNEALSDSATPGMSETECVVSAARWPNFAIDGNASSPVLFTDSSFINTALLNADKARKKLGSNMKLFVNDYNSASPSLARPIPGGNFPSQAKTECAFKVLANLQHSGVPVDGLGIQSHYSANPQAFPSKESAHFTMDRLKNMGLMGAITELDVWLPDNTTESLRWQASIFGDILDTCLFSSNCNEFLVWDNRDDESWLDGFNTTGVHQGTLFDASGNPKLPYFEVLARLLNFAQGGAEPCATSGGTSVCVV
ncbi:glycoside hydrolase superfamily [Mycena sp. CBHHK59/15]|nr:glycoside hydrolase superfamily [Mycena sp. CBHHK59/15]